MSEKTLVHNQWSSRMAFMLAAIGSAVGLGNIWKFPYITGEYGGGAFVLVYLVCILMIGMPVMMAEILLGRRGRRSPINTMRELAATAGASRLWGVVGWGGVVTGFLILSFYSVVAGWALAYVIEGVAGAFKGLDGESAGALFGELTASPGRLVFWHSVFMLMTTVVVANGVRSGLERLVTWLMPLLFVLLAVLVGYAMAAGDFSHGVHFLFDIDFSRVFTVCDEAGQCRFTAEPSLVAMGHAFFTLSLGMGAIMVYGSYMPHDASIAGSTVMIAVADTLVALMAGLAIFPLVFANGLEPAAGPGLVFVSLPIAFGAMPGGQLFGTLFFVLLVFAAWSSSISLVEPAVAWLTENRDLPRARAAWLVGGLAWLLGIGSALSFNLWSGEKYQLFGKTLFDIKDFLATNIMLPLGGLAIALFTGWAVGRRLPEGELAMRSPVLFGAWRFTVRYISPAGIVLIFLNAIGLV